MDKLTLDLNKIDHMMVEDLLRKGVDINYCGVYNNLCYSLLMAAVEENNDKLVEFILSKGADPNKLIQCHSKFAMTALHAAIFTENIKIKIIHHLLDYGANIDLSAIDGEKEHEEFSSPLQYAVHTENEVIVKLLLSKGANVNFKTKNDNTALHIACMYENSNIVDYLLKYGANVNAVSDNKLTKGQTAIYNAISWNQTEAVKLLLNNDADINIQDANGKSPLKLLNENTNDEIHVIMKQHVVKLVIANIHVNAYNLQEIVNDNSLNNFRNICKNEIEKMKTEKISGTNVLFYNIFIKNIHQLALYAKNKKIRSELSDPMKLSFLFPQYAFILVNRFKKGLHRKKLLERVENFILDIFIDKFPNTFIRQIFFYLSNDDLEILGTI
ncbi:putative ankyrin repeat protein RF_0381 [Microplitis demolitor]|uniref:putative ankyrin repeat protein RF_0381 n=1 Tax=Microplitis demolitor TaxID=69319 RepID=UPI0004CCDAD1|nr:putative ankyrin repeat protein RF_0381 [Microplitis demolitor]